MKLRTYGTYDGSVPYWPATPGNPSSWPRGFSGWPYLGEKSTIPKASFEVGARADFNKNRCNGSDTDNPRGEADMPGDGKATWITGTVDGSIVHGLRPSSGGGFTYEVRYDAGSDDLTWFEQKDRHYLTRILKEGNLRKLEPAVWYLRGEERIEDTDIGEWWSQKLNLPNIDVLLKEAEKAGVQLRRTCEEHPWEKEKREKTEHEQAERRERERAEQARRELVKQWYMKECTCFLSHKIMLIPMMASDGETYEREKIERWFETHSTSPKTGGELPDKRLIPNYAMQRHISRFLEAHPEMWEGDDVYFYRDLVLALIRAVRVKNVEEVTRLTELDKRLLIRPLTEDNQTLLRLALSSTSAVLEAVVTILGDRLWTLPEIVADKGTRFFQAVANHQGARGAHVMAEALHWTSTEIQDQLKVAIVRDDVKLAAVCLDCGADMLADTEDMRPLHRVIHTEQHALLRLLLERDADLELPNAQGDTALLQAVRLGNPQTLDILLHQKLELEAKDRNGTTALHVAFDQGHLDLIPLLAAAGADLEHKDSNGNSAFLRAVSAKRLDLVQLLLARPKIPARIDATNDAHENALHVAAQLGNTENDQALALFLLDHGVKGIARNIEGKKPEELAVARGHLELATAIDEKILDLRLQERGMLASSSPIRERPTIAGLRQADTIPFESLTYGVRVGEGAFATVFRGTWNKKEVAIKELLTPGLSTQAVEELGREALIMKQLRHPNILALWGVCIEPGHYSLVMEYAPKGALYDVLRREDLIAWPVRWNIALGIAKGVAHLHNHTPQILHRDLKSQNILLDERYVPRITDFGLSKVRTETRTFRMAPSSSRCDANPMPGTLAWMAPELFEPKTEYGRACDIFSLGVIFWELASSRVPWSNAVSDTLITLWMIQGKREEIPPETPPSYSKLIASCWAQRAETRPPVHEVVQMLETHQNEVLPADIPEAYLCPITSELMKDPVIDREGHTFERVPIEEWVKNHHSCPVSRARLELDDLSPNRALRDAIEEFTKKHLAILGSVANKCFDGGKFGMV